MKHLLKLADLTAEEIFGILNLADQLKYERKNGVPHPVLQGKKLGMIFTKSSTRTRVSFEVGMTELGGHSWGGESLSRIPCACFPAISTGS